MFVFSNFTGSKVQVALVDSGVELSHPTFRGRQMASFSFESDDASEPVEVDVDNDQIGHGTACASIILGLAPQVTLQSVRVFDSELQCPTSRIVNALTWCVANKVDVVNLSLGTRVPDDVRELERVCDWAAKEGLIIVAAESNDGEMSFPACFDSVLGVGATGVRGKYGYYWCQGRPVEILARGDPQRVAWKGGRHAFVGGSSFAAPRITGLAALFRDAFPKIPMAGIRGLFRAHATPEPSYLASSRERNNLTTMDRSISRLQPLHTNREVSDRSRWTLGDIRRAAIYPYTKEMHSLIRFKSQLSFEVSAVLDEPSRLLVGRDAGEAIGCQPCGLGVQSISRLQAELEEADTLIVGYVDEISRIKGRDVLGELIQASLSKRKNIYSFARVPNDKLCGVMDAARRQGTWVHYPEVVFSQLQGLLEKYRTVKPNVQIPVVGVFGTGPKQGKFTLQLALRYILRDRGFRVGQIASEHHAELFGIERTFPIGYASSVDLPMDAYIPYLRRIVCELDEMGYDVVLTGGQSGIVPFEVNTYSDVYTLPTIAYLMGTKPDIFVLVVNLCDEDEHIGDCLETLRILGKGETVALAFSDAAKRIQQKVGGQAVAEERLTPAEAQEFKDRLEKKFRIPAFEIGSSEGAQMLADRILAVLS